ncbi:hypothetical protein BKA82DRAFT_335529 [Pisolithus tinctorius]|uniref:Uncharacterized protein n=1 Tax=Pisolithus tinctorius Marx 270 TaxID=870435 RepID=A0A0C3N1F8_PISTI|nr:hypothetical protein BKA82DRAFT_335529 [Pisolithus tinctorius]KIN94909.1 hypothetical protein M404DRAFT_335529 [Pisolithus tinctorius Marx 270]
MKVFPSLDQAPTSIPRYQDTARSSQHAQANYPVSTSYTNEDGRFSIVSQLSGTATFVESLTVTQINGQPVQLLHHTASVPITQAHIPSQSYHHDTLLVNTKTPHYGGDVWGCTSGDTAYSGIALSSPNTSIMLPNVVEYSLGSPWENGNVSKFGKSPFAHHATTGLSTGLASTVLFSPTSNVSWLASSKPIVPLLQGPYPSDHLDSEIITAPVELAASSTWSTRKPYLPSSQEIKVSHSPLMPCSTNPLPRS